MRTTTRFTALAAACLALAAPTAAQAAGSGGSRALTDDEINALTCGHLGVSCATAKHAKKAKAARRSRSVRRVRAHIALQPIQR